MTCSCRANSVSFVSGAGLASFSPHEVHPDESCIFCAAKHLGVALTETLAGGSRSLALGEIELARRHTILEYSGVAKALAGLELDICLRNDRMLGARMKEAQSAVDAALNATAAAPQDNKRFGTLPALVDSCPFLGELHLCAAWRLAAEVGYMRKNKPMIIGDLALAREHLVRVMPDVPGVLRELRHRVQIAKSSDLDIYWPYIVGKVARFIDSKAGEWRGTYASGLAQWLENIAEDPQQPV